MQTKFTAIKAAVIAATLAFSGAAFAANTYNSAPVKDAGGLVVDFGGHNFNGTSFVGIPVIELTNTDNLQDKFLAFCIQPTVDLQQNTIYTATSGVSPSNAIKALYETSYASTLNNADKQVSFQLALWELKADDGNLYATSGQQYFTSGADARVGDAQAMLSNAAQHSVLTNMYSYTTFSGIGANGQASQQLLGVSVAAPVPEASTWAMLALGLGLVGFVGRRKASTATEKFA
jgi:hypothetical protein